MTRLRKSRWQRRTSRETATSFLYCLLHQVHTLDLSTQLRGNRRALELAVRRQQPVINRKWISADMKSANLFVMRQTCIDGINRGFHLARSKIACDDRGKIAAPVPHQ